MTLGGVVGHSICTGAAVLGGRHLASYVDERTMSLLGGLLFIAFGAHAYWEVRSCQSVYICVCAYSLSLWAEYLPSYYKSKRECRHARQSERHSRMKGLPGDPTDRIINTDTSRPRSTLCCNTDGTAGAVLSGVIHRRDGWKMSETLKEHDSDWGLGMLCREFPHDNTGKGRWML